MSQFDKIIFLGGDDRQTYMAFHLMQEGFPVAVYGLKVNNYKFPIYEAASLKDALSFGNLVICGVPFSKDNQYLYAKDKQVQISITELQQELGSRHTIFAGSFPESLVKVFKQKNIAYYDFMHMDNIAIANAVATAEGAIAEAIVHSPFVLHKSKCLILGYGRCGKILADKLSGLKAEITIAARSETALSLARAYGFQTVYLSDLKTVLPCASYVFNTIPDLILDCRNLSYISKDTVIIDLASPPYGVNFEYCRQQKLHAYLCSGLPGKYAPQTSALILIDAFLSALKSAFLQE